MYMLQTTNVMLRGVFGQTHRKQWASGCLTKTTLNYLNDHVHTIGIQQTVIMVFAYFFLAVMKLVRIILRIVKRTIFLLFLRSFLLIFYINGFLLLLCFEGILSFLLVGVRVEDVTKNTPILRTGIQLWVLVSSVMIALFNHLHLLALCPLFILFPFIILFSFNHSLLHPLCEFHELFLFFRVSLLL